MRERIKTNYPGVFFRESRRIAGKGTEKVYYIIFKKDGKLHEEKAGRQYADAMTPARAAGVRAERIEGKRLSPKQMREQQKALKDAEKSRLTIDTLWEKYKSSRPYNKTLETDDGRYKNYLKPVFGDKEPKDLLLIDIDRLKFKLLKKKAPQTVKHILNLIDRIVNFGVERNLCERLSFHIKKPTVNNLKTEDLSSEQLKKLLAAIDEDTNIHAQNLMKMALFTGMRRGELFKLKWDHVDFDRGFIAIVDPKGGPSQKIPLNDGARDILSSHPKTDNSDYVFPGHGGNQRVTISKAVNRIKERAGLPNDFRPLHGLRHVYASMLASSGQVDMYTLQKLLTHKSPQMTQRYAHLRDEALRRASDLAGTIINEASKEADKITTTNLEDYK